jgi:hypothetical protein
MRLTIAFAIGCGLAIGLDRWGLIPAIVVACALAAVHLWRTRATINRYGPPILDVVGVTMIYASLVLVALALEGVGYAVGLLIHRISN